MLALTLTMNYLIDNCYVTCGDSLFRQKIGIPMGTDCAPFLANLFLYSYEHEWMMKMKKTNPQLARQFNRSARYIDDLLTINNDGHMKKYMKNMYPAELELKHENSKSDKIASYLHLQLDVLNGEIVTSLYDKRSLSRLSIPLISLVTSLKMDRMEYSLLKHYDMPKHVRNTLISSHEP